MKKLILCFIITSIMHATNAQVTLKSDWEEMNLKDKVKSIRETSYKAVKVAGEIRKAERKRESKDENDTYTIFNYKGNVIEETEYTSDGNTFRKITYQYDDRENPIEAGWFDLKGRLTMRHRYVNKYDEQGNLYESTHFKPDGTPDNKYTYVHDDKGNLTESCWNKQDGSLGNKEIYKYDAKGNMLETETFTLEGKSEWKIIYRYDEHGNRIEEDDYRGTKFIIKYLRKFDAKGNQVEIEWCKENGTVYNKYIQVYEYDKQGNWTRQIQFRYDKPTYIYERELVYF